MCPTKIPNKAPKPINGVWGRGAGRGRCEGPCGGREHHEREKSEKSTILDSVTLHIYIYIYIYLYIYISI